MKILVINGPNMNLLGRREPDIYGSRTYEDLERLVEAYCDERSIECDFFQSNHEGYIIDRIQEADGVYDGIVINPAAYTHTSLAIGDALRAVSVPAVEVHVSDPDEREDFRRINFVRDAVIATVSGHSLEGYTEAISILEEKAVDSKV